MRYVWCTFKKDNDRILGVFSNKKAAEDYPFYDEVYVKKVRIYDTAELQQEGCACGRCKLRTDLLRDCQPKTTKKGEN